MKKWIGAAVLIGLGILIAFPLFSMTYYTMVRTSTPEFCASCHEIKPAVVAWRSSTHVNNPQGFVADCMDCHLPAPHKTFDFFFAKTFHGIKDVIKHFTIDEYDRQKNREAAYASFNNAECQKCHRNLLAHAGQARGHAGPSHRAVPTAGIREKMRGLPLGPGSQQPGYHHVQAVPQAALSVQRTEKTLTVA